ncbi:ATP-binding cassette domain-containing protein [Parabacteroides sp. PF5-9]|uniref:ATP-binding cassette domain-containing protein n=1 Tax=Parabacteroides sp. PF5-9 TaxID=1742404 RepID=UPI00247487CA|nr:ATP-binding cassette domain-containing protein [Parabacteroides sp. PF5-9]MDH6356914.1 molybdate transport system ATP-binding protein [Parabacteroides sp. PF5-9]
MCSEKRTITLTNVVPRFAEMRFKEAPSWTIKEGEQWAVVGPNGAGKTLLADILQKKLALKEGSVCLGSEGKISEQIKNITFKDIYSLTDCRNAYYQQRWHSTEIDQIPTVEELLSEELSGKEQKELLTLFHVTDLLPKKVIFLSSGELRKFFIVRTLLYKPKILILDNPFIGLDSASRIVLKALLQQIVLLKELQLILLVSDPQDIPEMITDVLPVIERRCMAPMKRDDFLADKRLISTLFPFDSTAVDELPLPVSPLKEVSTHQVTFRMENVSIRYGDRTILDRLSWEVRNGEKWALSGPNGSGKSTLLSLIYADNPQAYANTLSLFDRKRGTGESIWEIKKRIGYISPEMHLYYKENVPAIRIVGSGFFDSIGLHRKCSKEQEFIALQWMDLFGITHLKERLFLTLSSGEQRLVLLARVFVKNPDLIILDEPLHGLDLSNKKKVTAIIEQFCNRPGKTLIYVTHYPQELSACVNNSFELKGSS